jgi:hypothetical protein
LFALLEGSKVGDVFEQVQGQHQAEQRKTSSIAGREGQAQPVYFHLIVSKNAVCYRRF